MSWTQTIFEVIDMRSFSNLWFWIALAVVWSTASHWILGVPFDMLTRAKRHGGQAQADLESVVYIMASRILYITEVSGMLLLGFLSFALTALAVLGFVYDVEFAQALFLIGLPMSGVGALSMHTARGIVTEQLRGEALHRRLIRHRQIVQAIGVLAIFVTAMWGMWQNLDRSYLFNSF
ncbi:hypothetical protein OG2516_02479 [Oceanicola granulosus HTCC2516]|uniref:Component of SufBCD complex n=1 Tax=Oceanicola granulosus (strain ATCC BAA-861 / DSM 15982 / KCTC 12143 / HTCC2516) TaxID=314256 RepID=Q2CHM8_OCEGH|nr:hypothetical protein [Oceanicola granulosus]EAR52266.1 hypothetical protein OG2516_02479 [Oceanicola granulosus HTCC2516]